LGGGACGDINEHKMTDWFLHAAEPNKCNSRSLA